MNHCDLHRIISDMQHGFRQKHSCESQLVITLEEIARARDEGKQIDLLILDFTKAFDTVPHQRLLAKLKYYGIDGNLHKWVDNWLTGRNQTVVIDGERSSSKEVTSGVPQGTVLGPLMFLIYINDIQDSVQYSTTRLFADDCLLYRVINNAQDSDKLQSDLTRLQEWSETWQMQFNPKKCYLLSMQRMRNPIRRDYTLRGEVLAPV